MDSLSEPVKKNKINRIAKQLWCLEPDESVKSEKRLVKDANDAEFIDEQNFIVADSAGHGIYMFNINDNILSDPDMGKKTPSKENLRENAEFSKNSKGDGCSMLLEYNHQKYKTIISGEVWPNCLAVTRDSKIRLTDRRTKTIRTYDMRGDLISIWNPGENKMGKPHGVAVTSKNETIVSDASMHCIHVFSDTGQLLRSFGSRGDLLHHFRLPFFITVDTQDRVMVSDNMNYCVKIFETSGNFIDRIGSRNLFGQPQFQSPYGVTYDSSCNEILVSDHESNKIFAYNTNGEFQRYLLSGNDCESPCGLSINSNAGLLVVAMSNPDCSNVKVFKIINS